MDADADADAASDVDDAIDGIRTSRPDVVLVDVHMPGGGGLTLVEQVSETHPDMKGVFIWGFTEDSFRKRLDVAEDIHFLPKPFTLQQLASKVKEMMEETPA